MRSVFSGLAVALIVDWFSLPSLARQDSPFLHRLMDRPLSSGIRRRWRRLVAFIPRWKTPNLWRVKRPTMQLGGLGRAGVAPDGPDDPPKKLWHGGGRIGRPLPRVRLGSRRREGIGPEPQHSPSGIQSKACHGLSQVWSKPPLRTLGRLSLRGIRDIAFTL